MYGWLNDVGVGKRESELAADMELRLSTDSTLGDMRS
jgi:hypothetical protein